jgi:hypothetical protein
MTTKKPLKRKTKTQRFEFTTPGAPPVTDLAENVLIETAIRAATR